MFSLSHVSRSFHSSPFIFLLWRSKGFDKTKEPHLHALFILLSLTVSAGSQTPRKLVNVAKIIFESLTMLLCSQFTTATVQVVSGPR
jgi:hypothetical protein